MNTDDLKRITGQKISLLIDRKGWSTSELARRLGLKQQQVYDWTTGKTRMYGDQARAVAAALETTTDYLLDPEQSEPPVPLSDLERVFLAEIREVGVETAWHWHRELAKQPRELGQVGRDIVRQPSRKDGPA